MTASPWCGAGLCRVAHCLVVCVPSWACNADEVGGALEDATSSTSTASDPPPPDLPEPSAIRNGPFCRGAARAECLNAPLHPALVCNPAECEDCTRLAEVETLFVYDRFDTVVVGPDRSTLVYLEAHERVERRDAAGNLLWSTEEPNDDVALALTPAGDALVTSRPDGDARPRLTAIDDAGDMQWTTALEDHGWFDHVLTDGNAILATGAIEQINAPTNRGFVARFAMDGTLGWSQKVSEVVGFTSVAFAGEDVVLHGDGVVWEAPRRLVRLDANGGVRWSLDSHGATRGRVEALADAGDGRAWAFGYSEYMAWGAVVDAGGEIAVTLDCDDPILRTWAHHIGMDGNATIAARRDDGIVAVAVSTDEAGSWITWIEDDKPVAARYFEERFAHVLQLQWDHDGELLAVIGYYDGDREPNQWIDVVVVPR